MGGASLKIRCPSPKLAQNSGREAALEKAFALDRRGRRDCRAADLDRRTGGGEELFGPTQDLPGVLRKELRRLPRLPRQVRRVPSGMPVKRLLGKQDCRQGMRLRSAVGGGAGE